LDPCIPAQWNGFRATRKFRNAIYTIEVVNTAHMSKGIKTLVVDGKEIRGNVIPIYDDGNEHIVRAIM
jgi:cellobiose phosphorylase